MQAMKCRVNSENKNYQTSSKHHTTNTYAIYYLPHTYSNYPHTHPTSPKPLMFHFQNLQSLFLAGRSALPITFPSTL